MSASAEEPVSGGDLHLAPDYPRLPLHPSASVGEPNRIHVGTWRVEPGQSVGVEARVRQAVGDEVECAVCGTAAVTRQAPSLPEGVALRV